MYICLQSVLNAFLLRHYFYRQVFKQHFEQSEEYIVSFTKISY